MDQVPDHFDEIHFTESRIGTPVVGRDCLRIPVKGLFLMRGHPLLSHTPGPIDGTMIFEGVARSVRTVVEYLGDPRHPSEFKEPRQEQDGPFSSETADGCQDFEFEGLWESPPAWIDKWTVRARRFFFRPDGT